jgi:hypothetical protein
MPPWHPSPTPSAINSATCFLRRGQGRLPFPVASGHWAINVVQGSRGTRRSLLLEGGCLGSRIRARGRDIRVDMEGWGRMRCVQGVLGR